MLKKLKTAEAARFDTLSDQLDIYNNWIEYTEHIVVNQNWIGPSKAAAFVINHYETIVTIADIGCGTGISGALLSLAGYRKIDGYDIVEQYINTSQKFYRKTAYCDILKTPLPIKYDVILASGIFNFHCLSALPAKNIYNSINPNGCFVMINPSRSSNYLEASGWIDQKYFDFVDVIGPYTGRKETKSQYYKYETNILKPTQKEIK